MNYLPVLKRINKLMTAKGYTLTSVGDGEELLKAEDALRVSALYEWATQCDLGSMNYKDASGNSVSYYLIYGNGIWETIADYGWNTEQAEKDADEVSDDIYDFYQ